MRVAVLRWLMLAVAIVAAVVLPIVSSVAGCGPRVIREPAPAAPPAGCVQGATTCHAGAPWRCGPGGVWSQADRVCSRIAADGGAPVCCAARAPFGDGVVHACVPTAACAADGGAL